MSAHSSTFRATLAALALSVSLTPALSVPAFSDTITRGCSARIVLRGDTFENIVLVDLDARGTCEGRRNANRCRLRAHDQLRSCFNAVRNDWADHDIPQVCRPSEGLRTGMNQFECQGVYGNFPNENQSIEDRIRYKTCCSGGGRIGVQQASVLWVISGDRGCSGSTSSGTFGDANISQGFIWEDIETECGSVWDSGMCPGQRPTGTRANPTE